MADEAVRILRVHVDLESSQIGVEFRKLDVATGRYEPAEPHEGAVQLLPLSADVRAALERDVLSTLIADVLDVPDAHPAALTSVLHQIRETRLEAERTRREADDHVRRTREEAARAKEEKEEAERLRVVAERATNDVLSRHGA